MLVVEHHPHRPLTQLAGYLPCLVIAPSSQGSKRPEKRGRLGALQLEGLSGLVGGRELVDARFGLHCLCWTARARRRLEVSRGPGVAGG
jgi:hypothetical protein